MVELADTKDLKSFQPIKAGAGSSPALGTDTKKFFLKTVCRDKQAGSFTRRSSAVQNEGGPALGTEKP